MAISKRDRIKADRADRAVKVHKDWYKLDMSELNVMKNVIYSHCEDMCGESADRISVAKSREATQSMELSTGASKPSK